MSKSTDPTDTVGWKLRFDRCGGRHTDVFVGLDDLSDAMRQARQKLGLGNDSAFPEKTPMDEKMCESVGLHSGQVVVK